MYVIFCQVCSWIILGIRIVNGQLWTVPYELYCYCALAIIAQFGLKKWRVLGPVIVVIVLQGYLLWILNRTQNCSGAKRRKEAVSFRRVPCRCFRIFLSRDSSLGPLVRFRRSRSFRYFA
jgi:hypothetical protein